MELFALDSGRSVHRYSAFAYYACRAGCALKHAIDVQRVVGSPVRVSAMADYNDIMAVILVNKCLCDDCCRLLDST